MWSLSVWHFALICNFCVPLAREGKKAAIGVLRWPLLAVFFFSLASLINRHDSRPVGSLNEPVRLITGHKFQLAVQVLGQLAGKLHTGQNGQLAKSLTKARWEEAAGNKHMRGGATQIRGCIWISGKLLTTIHKVPSRAKTIWQICMHLSHIAGS